MKASGSGRTPENFWIAASTSSVAASPSGPRRLQRLCLLPPFSTGDVGEELEQHVGHGPSDTPSISTLRSVRPPSKSGGALRTR
jgi:hypothetical protein